MTQEADNFLAHYGVKGMKWGVRKSSGPRSAEDLAKRQQRIDTAKKVAIGAAFVATTALLAYSAAEVNKSRNFMSAEPSFIINDPRAQAGMSFEKGHEFFRQSKSAETTLQGRTYAFSDRADANSFMGKHDIRVTARETVKVATAREVRDTLATVVDKKDFVSNKKTIKGKIAAATMTREGIANAKLNSLNTSWWRGSDAEKVLTELRLKGFGAMVDPVMDGSAKILFGEDLFDVKTK